MKRILTTLTILMVIILTGCKKEEKKQEKFVLRLGHLGNEKTDWQQASEKLASYVLEKSNGRLEIKIYPNAQLGSELDTLRQIRNKTADMTITLDNLQNWDLEEVGVVGLPYLIESSEELEKVANGKVGKILEKEIIQKSGMRPLLWMERKPRYLTSNRPITTPEDLKNFTIRVPNVPMYAKVWEGLGAKPTPMAFNEVFTSLQQNTIDGQENPLSLISSAGLYEVQTYINKTEHIRGWIYLVIGEEQYKGLPEDLKKVLLEGAEVASKYHRELINSQEEELEKFLKEKGMQFIEVDKNKFKEKALQVVEKNLTVKQKELYNQILDMKKGKN